MGLSLAEKVGFIRTPVPIHLTILLQPFLEAEHTIGKLLIHMHSHLGIVWIGMVAVIELRQKISGQNQRFFIQTMRFGVSSAITVTIRRTVSNPIGLL